MAGNVGFEWVSLHMKGRCTFRSLLLSLGMGYPKGGVDSPGSTALQSPGTRIKSQHQNKHQSFRQIQCLIISFPACIIHSHGFKTTYMLITLKCRSSSDLCLILSLVICPFYLSVNSLIPNSILHANLLLFPLSPALLSQTS